MELTSITNRSGRTRSCDHYSDVSSRLDSFYGLLRNRHCRLTAPTNWSNLWSAFWGISIGHWVLGISPSSSQCQAIRLKSHKKLNIILVVKMFKMFKATVNSCLDEMTLRKADESSVSHLWVICPTVWIEFSVEFLTTKSAVLYSVKFTEFDHPELSLKEAVCWKMSELW